MLSPVSVLRNAISGIVILPGDADYDEAREAWYLTVDQRPAFILFPASAQDIDEAISFAHEHCLDIAIQSAERTVMLPTRACLLIITSQNPFCFERDFPAAHKSVLANL